MFKTKTFSSQHLVLLSSKGAPTKISKVMLTELFYLSQEYLTNFTSISHYVFSFYSSNFATISASFIVYLLKVFYQFSQPWSSNEMCMRPSPSKMTTSQIILEAELQPFQSSQYCALFKTDHSHLFYISHKSVLNKLEKILSYKSFQKLDLFFLNFNMKFNYIYF